MTVIVQISDLHFGTERPPVVEALLALAEALGPDLDQPVSPSNPSLLERGVDEAKDAAVKSIGRTTEGVMPFRSWVRRLTGAEKYHRKVMAAVRATEHHVGGELCGPMILPDYATPGAGTMEALQVLAALKRTGKPASELLHLFDPVPQLLKNVRFGGGEPLEHEAVRRVIAQAEGELNGCGRLVIRPSGTEPVIRVMAEGDSEDQVRDVVDRICAAVEQAAG